MGGFYLMNYDLSKKKKEEEEEEGIVLYSFKCVRTLYSNPLTNLLVMVNNSSSLLLFPLFFLEKLLSKWMKLSWW